MHIFYFEQLIRDAETCRETNYCQQSAAGDAALTLLLAHNNQTSVYAEGVFRRIAFSVKRFTDFPSQVVAFK